MRIHGGWFSYQGLRFVTRNMGSPARNALEEYERIKDNIGAVKPSVALVAYHFSTVRANS